MYQALDKHLMKEFLFENIKEFLETFFCGVNFAMITKTKLNHYK